MDIFSERIDIPAATISIDSYIFYPKNKISQPTLLPAIILFTDIRGPRSVYDELASRLAAQGYYVVMPHIYYREGTAPVIDPTIPVAEEPTFTKRRELAATLTTKAQEQDFSYIIDWLEHNPHVIPHHYGVVGYCMTGPFALRLAALYPEHIVAAAGFHGANYVTGEADSVDHLVKKIKGAVYLGHAKEDALNPQSAIDQLGKALAEGQINYQNIIYDAGHGYTMPDLPAFDQKASEKAFKNLVQFFDHYLKV